MYQFSAADPEGSTVLFTLGSGPRGAVLSPAGLLIWKALSSSPVTFKLAVTDDCNAEATATVEVSKTHSLYKPFGSDQLHDDHLFLKVPCSASESQ